MAPMCCIPPDGMSSNFCSDVEDMRRTAAIDVHGHFGDLSIPRLATGAPTNTQNGALRQLA